MDVGYCSSFWLRRSPWESDMQVSKCVRSTCSECSGATECYHCNLWGPMTAGRTVKSHASLRPSTVWAGSFLFLTHEDIHWLSICLPRNPWAEMSLETVVPNSTWQCSPLSKPLTHILVCVTVDCYRTETPQTHLSFFSPILGTLIKSRTVPVHRELNWMVRQFRAPPPPSAELFLRNCALSFCLMEESYRVTSLVLGTKFNGKDIFPDLRNLPKGMGTWWGHLHVSGSQSPTGLPYCRKQGEKSPKRSWASAYSWGCFVCWLDHFWRFQHQSSKACAAHKEEVHTSQEQPKPAHPFIWLRTLRKTTKLNNF